MRRAVILLSLLMMIVTACRDHEETALQRLDRRGYAFRVADYHRAAEKGDESAVLDFIRAGMEIDVEDEKGNTAFRYAAMANQSILVMTLLDHQAAVDQRLADGTTALIRFAGIDGDVRFLERLLEAGANPQAVDGSGLTPLLVAARHGNIDAVRLLLSRDRSNTDKALMLASSKGHTHCMEALINEGAHVNCRSKNQSTPLMQAATAGHQEAVSLLVRHWANPMLKDSTGATAADRAARAGHSLMADHLRESPPPAHIETVISLDSQTVHLTGLPSGNKASVEPERPRLEPDPLNAAKTPKEPVPPQAETVPLSTAVKLGPFREKPGSHEKYLLIEFPESGQMFAARAGDSFTVAESAQKWTVTRVLPHQWHLREADSDAVLVLNRW